MRNLISLTDLKSSEVERIFSITEDLKSRNQDGERDFLLPGRVLALLFEKPSLRTRVSFESAIAHLGGTSLFLSDDVGFGKRESVEDFARVLGQYVDAIVVRAKKHAIVEQLAELSGCVVVNGLTDSEHPCQALADLYTLREIHGPLRGKKLAYVGDGNNVARSLALGCGKVGVEFALAAPKGYEFSKDFCELLDREVPDLKMTVTQDPREAVDGAAGVYTDVWASMGQEAEHEVRKKAFADYQVDAKLMEAAPSDACFLHCLPARRGEEVTSEVIDGPQSVVVQQAGNRMHVQKGVLAWLLGASS